MMAKTKDSAAIAKEIEGRKKRLKEIQEREKNTRRELEEARDSLGVATARGEDDRDVKDRVRGLAEDLEGTVRAISILEREIGELEGARGSAETEEAIAVASVKTQETLEAAEAVAKKAHAFLKEFRPAMERLDARFDAEKRAEIRARQLRGDKAAYTQTSAKAQLWSTHRPLFAFMEAARQFERYSAAPTVDPAA